MARCAYGGGMGRLSRAWSMQKSCIRALGWCVVCSLGHREAGAQGLAVSDGRQVPGCFGCVRRVGRERVEAKPRFPSPGIARGLGASRLPIPAAPMHRVQPLRGSVVEEGPPRAIAGSCTRAAVIARRSSAARVPLDGTLFGGYLPLWSPDTHERADWPGRHRPRTWCEEDHGNLDEGRLRPISRDPVPLGDRDPGSSRKVAREDHASLLVFLLLKTHLLSTDWSRARSRGGPRRGLTGEGG